MNKQMKKIKGLSIIAILMLLFTNVSFASAKASKEKKACEGEKANSQVLSDSTFSSTSSNLQEKKVMLYEIPKVVSCDVSSTSFGL